MFWCSFPAWCVPWFSHRPPSSCQPSVRSCWAMCGTTTGQEEYLQDNKLPQSIFEFLMNETMLVAERHETEGQTLTVTGCESHPLPSQQFEQHLNNSTSDRPKWRVQHIGFSRGSTCSDHSDRCPPSRWWSRWRRSTLQHRIDTRTSITWSRYTKRCRRGTAIGRQKSRPFLLEKSGKWWTWCKTRLLGMLGKSDCWLLKGGGNSGTRDIWVIREAIGSTTRTRCWSRSGTRWRPSLVGWRPLLLVTRSY